MSKNRTYSFRTKWFGFLVGFTICSIVAGTSYQAHKSLLGNQQTIPTIQDIVFAKEVESNPTLLIDLQDRITKQEINDLENQLGIPFRPVSTKENQAQLFRLSLPIHTPIHKVLQLLEKIRKMSQVEAADIDFQYSIPENGPDSLTKASDEALSVKDITPAKIKKDKEPFSPNDPKYKYQWHLDQIHMPEAWNKFQGEGAIVAVIDTGVARVEDLQGPQFVPGWNFIQNNENAADDHGHGTHVAGTIAQMTNNGIGVAGIAFKAKIMPIKVLSASGSGSIGGIVAGIYFAVDHGAKVINMSLGGPYYSSALDKAIQHARKKGVVVVCAAGNDGKGRVSYPAANQGAIAVAATQFDEKTTFYSNWGKEITIAAPGGNTRLDQNGDGVPDGVMQNTVVPGQTDKQDYLLFMGTSMASPHVAGVAALLVGAGLQDPNQIEKILKDTARKPVHYQGKKDPHYGAGIVDAAAALNALAKKHGQTNHPSILVLLFVFGFVGFLGRKWTHFVGYIGACLWIFIGYFTFQTFSYHVETLQLAEMTIQSFVFLSIFPVLLIPMFLWQYQNYRPLFSGFFLGQGVFLFSVGISLVPLSGLKLWFLFQGVLCLGVWWFLRKTNKI